MYPSIITYLGSEPWPEPKKLGERLVAERRRRGLAVRLAAIVIGVDEGTLARWESGEWRPQNASWKKVGRFLAGAAMSV